MQAQAVNLEFVKDARFVTNGLPWETDRSGDYKIFNFTAEEFDLAQVICGSKLSGDFSKNAVFLKGREDTLSAEANQNYEDQGHYGLSFPHCQSGLFSHEDFYIFWYETTSGTIYAVSFEGEVPTEYVVYLPLSRATATGVHHQHLLYVANGMTEAQYKDWYDNYRDDKESSYQEQVNFHNVIPGLEPMKTLAERQESRRLAKEKREADKEDFENFSGAEEEIDYEEE